MEKPLGSGFFHTGSVLLRSAHAATSPLADLQPGWPQLHASSIVSRASLHDWLQYLPPFIAVQEQAGWAHLLFSSMTHLIPWLGCISAIRRVPTPFRYGLG
jgi:hypothetical protein